MFLQPFFNQLLSNGVARRNGGKGFSSKREQFNFPVFITFKALAILWISFCLLDALSRSTHAEAVG